MPNYVTDVFFGLNDRKTFFESTNKMLGAVVPAGVFAGDNLITFGRNLGFLEDEKFVAAVRKHSETNVERAVVWRTHVLAWAAQQALKVAGDFVECGCYKGYSARVLHDYLDFAETGRHFWLYDLFAHSDDMPHHAMPEHSESLHETVKKRFADNPRVHVIQGAVPGSFEQGTAETIAFLHVDMNNVAAEMGALDVLFDRVVDGGMIVFDDYGWFAYRGQKLAEDPWLAERGHTVLELPTGQGLVIKRSPKPEPAKKEPVKK